MNILPLILRLIILSSLLISAFAVTPDMTVQAPSTQAVSTQAVSTQAVVQRLSSTPDQISPKPSRLDHKWSIKVRNWAKPFRRGGQARIDRCQATLWWGSLPKAQAKRPTWLAGHNYCGFWRWDKWLPVGSHFSIRGPAGHVHKYKVYRRKFINRKSGSSAGLVLDDITLVTCRGSGMSFVYGHRQD